MNYTQSMEREYDRMRERMKYKASIAPTTVDLKEIYARYPKHENCGLVIDRSKKNPAMIGLYCQKHGSYLCWLNAYQVHWLVKQGVRNLTDFNGYENREQGPQKTSKFVKHHMTPTEEQLEKIHRIRKALNV